MPGSRDVRDPGEEGSFTLEGPSDPQASASVHSMIGAAPNISQVSNSARPRAPGYLHRNPRGPQAALLLRWLGWKPVKRGLVRAPGDWKWSSFRHYAFREMGVVEIES